MDVWCEDCDDTADIDNANRYYELMLTLAAVGPELAKLSKAIIKANGDSLEVSIDGRYISLLWFEKHEGHRLHARSEWHDVLGRDENGKEVWMKRNEQGVWEVECGLYER
jgi:hypothetical protein